uniref:Uncharacterized protein n=1 Tax=Klebsiella pneumoniae TaxID=573 RepID=A0A8B0STR6_KLEPN|nr:hypothetical protein [Klebsiella pneumoniae]
MRVSVPACGVPARGRYFFHRGDVDTAPFAVTSGDMTPESSESGINLRCGDICAQNARMTTGLYSACGR